MKITSLRTIHSLVSYNAKVIIKTLCNSYFELCIQYPIIMWHKELKYKLLSYYVLESCKLCFDITTNNNFPE